MATAHFTDNEGNVLSRQGATPLQLEVDTYLTRVMKLRTAHDRTYLVANRFIFLDGVVQSRTAGPHISIEMMKQKSDNGLYSVIEDLRSDVNQLVKTWKEAYTDKSSEEWKDAERVRKNASEYFSDKNKRRSMVNTTTPGDFSEAVFTQDPPFFQADQDYHPAYPFSSSSHQPFDSQPIANSAQVQSVKRKRGRPPLNRQSMDDQMTEMSLAQQRAGTPVSPNQLSPLFEGKSFQEAQEIIVRELKQKATARDEDEFSHFINLPSRELKDYYEATPNLQSINLLEKKILGFQGKNMPLTGKSEFNTWDAFLKAGSLLWTNATNYNTEDCDVYRAAVRLEPWFMERYKAAKSMVPEPQVRLRLTQPQPQTGNRIRLNLSGSSQANLAGMSVDPEALRRQHREIAESAILRPRGNNYFFSSNGSAQQLPANGQWHDYPAPDDYEGITRFHGYNLVPLLASETYEENLARRNRERTLIDTPLDDDNSDDWDRFDVQQDIFDNDGPWSLANGGPGGIIPGNNTPLRLWWKRGDAQRFSPIKKMRLLFHNEPAGASPKWHIYEYEATPLNDFADSAYRFTKAVRKRPQVCLIQVFLNHRALGHRLAIPNLTTYPCPPEEKADDFQGHKPARKYPFRKHGWAFGEAPDLIEWDAKPIEWGENEFKVDIFCCPPGDPENDETAPPMTRGNERENEVLIMSVKFVKKVGPIEDEETDDEGGQSD